MSTDGFENYAARAVIDTRETDVAQTGLRDIVGFLWRNWLPIVAAMVACLSLGVIYIRSAEQTFTATARVVIDPEQARIASQDSVSGAIIIETGEVESQIEIVKSEAIAMTVIERLKLIEDPELQDNLGWRARIAAFLPFLGVQAAEPVEDTPELVMRRTVAGYFTRLRVWRVGQSYVMEIAYTSSDPAKAARIANAAAQHYIQAGLEAKAQAARSGATWLEGRLAEISNQVNRSARAVQEFRSANNISQAGETSLDQQQLAETSTQLSAAKADTASQRARLTTIERLLQSGDLAHGYVDEALTSLQITTLRENLIAATTRLEELRSRYGPQGTAVRAVEAEIAGLKAGIREELMRIGQVYRANLETAERREDLLSAQFQGVLEAGADKNKARVDLIELESRANTYRQMYESVMQQLMTALQQASFPVGDARIVATAATPLQRTWPQSGLIVAMSLSVGAMLGLGIAGLRETLDRRIRNPTRLRRYLDLPTMGVVPRARFQHKNARATDDGGADEILYRLNYALEEPDEPFTLALRAAMASIDLMFRPGQSRIIGITSAIAGEGKTTMACNLAHLYASSGSRTILIDACCRNATLTDTLISGESPALAVASDLRQTMQKHEGAANDRAVAVGRKSSLRKNGTAGLPILAPPLLVGVESIASTSERFQRNLNFPALRSHLERLRARHDVIILDLPDLESSADARLVSAFVDAMVAVVGNQRKVTLDRLENAIASCGASRTRLFGVLLNKVKQRRFSSFFR